MSDQEREKSLLGGGIKALVGRYLQESLAKYRLTEREMAVALELMSGRTYGEIAKRLFITERTVKFHAQNIYGKLGVANRREFMQFIDALP